LLPRALSSDLLLYHENLTPENHHVTSLDTDEYNCIAWALDDQDNWWWPSDDPEDAFWPNDVPRVPTVDAFLQAFATKGYELCQSSEREAGYEKIALFVLGGIPQHAARQLDNGQWTSKLGRYEDIEHTDLEALTDRTYGSVELILRRPRAGEAARQQRRRARQTGNRA